MVKILNGLAVVLSTVLVSLHRVDAVDEAPPFWRLPCRGRTGVARIDPLAQFGRPSNHAHAIHGGNSFHFEAKFDDVMSSECTSCAVRQDKSVYWTPALYFQHEDGKTELVEQNGGMLVYYFLFGENVQAFPPGFQMIAGDTKRREFNLPVPDPPKSEWTREDKTEEALRQKALGFNCLNYTKGTPEPTLFRHFLPDKAYLDANCPNGVRLELMFPSCWNGELDSPDHMSHMAYPDLGITGACPEGFEKRVVSLLYETIWETYDFVGKPGQFVLADGDTTGYGYHGDFIAGWDPDFLSQAIQTCRDKDGIIERCPLFDLQSQDEQRSCKMTLPDAIKDEDCVGPLDGLPGHVERYDGASNKALDKGDEYGDKEGQGKDGDDGEPGRDDDKKEEQSGDEAEGPSDNAPIPEVPTLSYSAASIVASNVPAGLDLASTESSSAAAADQATTTATTSQSFVSTLYRTEGGRVTQIFVVQETVSVGFEQTETVTLTADATGQATPTPSGQGDADADPPQGYNYMQRRSEHVHRHSHQHLHRRNGRGGLAA